jgi:MarR family transcriptional regulator for hemolysin
MKFDAHTDISRLPGALVYRTARLWQRWADERFQSLGLAVAQLPVLIALKDGSALTQKELARLAQIEQPTMALLLDRMERDGLIRRAAHETDKRSSLIRLTPLALKQLPRAKSILLQGNKTALRGFTDDEISMLIQLLLRVLQNLDAVMIRGTPK